MINGQQLKIFLKEAKINTYAKAGEGGEQILRDNGKRFEYKKGKLHYRDTYFGSDIFMGEEIVFYQSKPVWGMNYYGSAFSQSVSNKEVYLFLKKALQKVTQEKPYRGPSHFMDKYFRYINKVNGSIKEFWGEEKIFYKKELVYILKYHGGLID